jgi:hypothetical protein
MKPTAPTIKDFLAEPSAYEIAQVEILQLHGSPITAPTLKFKQSGIGREHRLLNDSELALVKRVIALDAQAKEFKSMADAAFKRCVSLGSLIDDLKAQLETAKNLIKL